jgi:hypothetical protein
MYEYLYRGLPPRTLLPEYTQLPYHRFQAFYKLRQLHNMKMVHPVIAVALNAVVLLFHHLDNICLQFRKLQKANQYAALHCS